MKKRIAALVTAGVLALSMLTGCGSKQESWKVTCPWAPSGVAAMVSQKAAAKSPDYSDNKGTWRLDFAKDNIAIEVAFNHGGNVSWNLIKPVLSSELNHVKKAIQTQAGVVITATDAMKKAGGFDNAIGTYEKYVEYLKPLNNLLTTPMMIIGLEPPKKFTIEQKKEDGNMVGHVKLKEEDNNF